MSILSRGLSSAVFSVEFSSSILGLGRLKGQLFPAQLLAYYLCIKVDIHQKTAQYINFKRLHIWQLRSFKSSRALLDFPDSQIYGGAFHLIGHVTSSVSQQYSTYVIVGNNRNSVYKSQGHLNEPYRQVGSTHDEFIDFIAKLHCEAQK